MRTTGKAKRSCYDLDASEENDRGKRETYNKNRISGRGRFTVHGVGESGTLVVQRAPHGINSVQTLPDDCAPIFPRSAARGVRRTQATTAVHAAVRAVPCAASQKFTVAHETDSTENAGPSSERVRERRT